MPDNAGRSVVSSIELKVCFKGFQSLLTTVFSNMQMRYFHMLKIDISDFINKITKTEHI